MHQPDPRDDLSEAQKTWLATQQEDLEQRFGAEAVMAVMQMTALFADLLHIDRGNAPLIKEGVNRMASVVNDMLPSLNQRGVTRVYNHRDLNGVLDPIPPKVQDVFVLVVGDVLLHGKGGPFDAAVNINEKLDQLDEIIRQRNADA